MCCPPAAAPESASCCRLFPPAVGEPAVGSGCGCDDASAGDELAADTAWLPSCCAIIAAASGLSTRQPPNSSRKNVAGLPPPRLCGNKLTQSETLQLRHCRPDMATLHQHDEVQPELQHRCIWNSNGPSQSTFTAPAGTNTRPQPRSASRAARSAGLWKVGSTGASDSTVAVTAAKSLASWRLCGDSSTRHVSGWTGQARLAGPHE